MRNRILEISKKLGLSHLGSNVSMVEILDDIYQTKDKDEPFILSNGHAGLALYVALEKYEGKNAEKLFKKHGVHPSRDLDDGIWCSTGSLGHGLGIAVGMALADRTKNVYVSISDGECAEGSIWEALRIAEENNLKNLHVYVNANGYGAYKKIDSEFLYWDLAKFLTPNIHFYITDSDINNEIKGLDSHYKKL